VNSKHKEPNTIIKILKYSDWGYQTHIFENFKYLGKIGHCSYSRYEINCNLARKLVGNFFLMGSYFALEELHSCP
jgi:hypothetical protein